MTTKEPHWAECEHPKCQRFFWNETGGRKFCSQSCARSYDFIKRKPAPPELLDLIEEFLRQPEMENKPTVERVAWRVFGKYVDRKD